MSLPPITFATRFRGFLPVVVDLETGGFNARTDALLEIAAVLIEMRSDGTLARGTTFRYHVIPFPGSNMEPASMAVNGIDPYHPLRPAIPEEDALQRIFKEVRNAVRIAECTRAVLVGHNSSFDLNFLNAAVARAQIKRSPFHPFSSFDTATLGGVAFGQTVLMRATLAAGLDWDSESAHSAGYDAERSADLFCTVCNQFQGVYEASRRRLASMGPLEVTPSDALEAAADAAAAELPSMAPGGATSGGATSSGATSGVETPGVETPGVATSDVAAPGMATPGVATPGTSSPKPPEKS